MMGLLATGGMAEVYLALSGELTGFRTLVVVKRILPHLSENADFIRMFFDEARIVALLDHPNIVRIIEVGHDGDEYFLAMEVIQGKPLSALVRKALKSGMPLSQAQAAFLIAQAANGLGHAHDLVDANGVPLNVVHRDVSPQNILVSYEGSVKVIDFGVARAMGRTTETRPGGLKGKVQYMAPEQATAGPVDRRSDVFSLGVMLWEAICGRRPFQRATDLSSLRAVVEESIPPPSKYVSISSRLEGIVMRAVHRNPAERFQTAQEMALALERYAFASNGFNPAQIATTMKGLFAEDFARWKNTIAAVKNMEGEPDAWTNTGGTYLNPEKIDLKTRGSTVALQPVPRAAPVAAAIQDSASDARSSLPSLGTLSPISTPRGPQRPWQIAAAVVLWVAALATGLATWTRVLSPVTEILRVDQTEAAEPGAGAITDAANTSSSQTLLDTDAGTAVISSSDDSPARSEVDGAAATATAQDTPPVADTSDSGGRAEKRARRAAARATAAVRAVRKHVRAGVAAAPGDRDATARCAVRLGTKPWAAVWIDGQDTQRHTPFSDTVACGARKLTFKRADLGLEKTFTVTAIAGQTLKQSFSLND